MPGKQHRHYNMRRSQVGGILHKHKQEVTGKMPKYYYRKGHYRELRELSRGNPNESVRAILNSEPPGDVTMPEDVFGVWGAGRAPSAQQEGPCRHFPCWWFSAGGAASEQPGRPQGSGKQRQESCPSPPTPAKLRGPSHWRSRRCSRREGGLLGSSNARAACGWV